MVPAIPVNTSVTRLVPLARCWESFRMPTIMGIMTAPPPTPAMPPKTPARNPMSRLMNMDFDPQIK